MESSKYLVFTAFLVILSTSTAVLIFTHTTNNLGRYTINAEGKNKPMDLASLNVDSIIATANGNDIGINYADYFSIVDRDLDELLQFTLSNDDNISILTGTAFYGNEDMVAFTSSHTDELVGPASSVPPPAQTPYVSEPSTVLFLGTSLIGIGIAHSRMHKKNNIFMHDKSRGAQVALNHMSPLDH
jgi:hypothetical protein